MGNSETPLTKENPMKSIINALLVVIVMIPLVAFSCVKIVVDKIDAKILKAFSG